jgi:hypothetical protein
MTHDGMRRRIKALQDFYSWRKPPTETCSIFFVDNNGDRSWCNVARGYDGFVCRRFPDESLEAFHERAGTEALACSSNTCSVPVGLLFSQEGA